MESGQRDMRVGMFRLQPDRLLQRLFHLGAQTLRQRLGDADALAVAPERISLPVPGIGVFRVRRLLRLGAPGNVHEKIEFGFFLAFEVVGINAGGLVGHRDAVTTGLDAGIGRLLKLAVMKQHPGLQHHSLLGQWFAVALVQADPASFQAGSIKGVVTCVGESGPFGHVVVS